jgi:hypothetical protein
MGQRSDCLLVRECVEWQSKAVTVNGTSFNRRSRVKTNPFQTVIVVIGGWSCDRRLVRSDTGNSDDEQTDGFDLATRRLEAGGRERESPACQ